MTKIRSRDSLMIQDRRGAESAGVGGGLGGMSRRRRRTGRRLGDVLGGALGRGGGRGWRRCSRRGGIIGILVLLATLFLPQLLGGGAGPVVRTRRWHPRRRSRRPAATTTRAAARPSRSSAAPRSTCRSTGASSSPRRSTGCAYPQTQTVFFSGFTNTGCGQASAQTGPFYCPADNLVYFDLDFLAQLQSDFGAEGDLAAQYIVAHEYGHHIQNVLGINAEMHRLQQQDPRNANAYSVALELQADCLAGAWANDANARNQFDSAREIEEALGAAAAVGDDAHPAADARVVSTPRAGPTDRPSSGCDGSTSASPPVTRTVATPSAT